MKHAIIAVVASLFLSGRAFAQDKQAYAEACARFGQVFAASSSKGGKDPDLAEAIKRVGDTTYAEVDRQTLQMILQALQKELAKSSNGKFEERVSFDVLNESANALGKITNDKVIDEMINIAKNKGGEWRLRYYVMRGLAQTKSDKVKTVLMELVYSTDKKGNVSLTKEDPHIQIAAVQLLAERGDKEALDVFHRVMKEPTLTWEAKVSALEGIRKVNDPSSIEHLIEALGKVSDAEGRLKTDIIETLQKMTNIQLESSDPNDWKAAWAAKKEGKDPKTEGATGVVPTKFYGLKAKTTRVVFVLDKSGSMMEKASEPEDPPDPEEKPKVSTGGAKVKNPDPLDPTRELTPVEAAKAAEAKQLYDKWMAQKPGTRIEVLKKQLIKTLYNLDHRVWFTIIWYDTSVQLWREELVQATWANKVEAIKDAEKISAAGATNLGDALIEYALKIFAKPAPKPEIPVGGKYDKNQSHVQVINGPDTIFVLTDGEPNAGKYADQSEMTGNTSPKTKSNILNELRKVNQLRKVVIHGICIGDRGGQYPVDPDFMKKIAEENGGQFKHVAK